LVTATHIQKHLPFPALLAFLHRGEEDAHSIRSRSSGRSKAETVLSRQIEAKHDFDDRRFLLEGFAAKKRTRTRKFIQRWRPRYLWLSEDLQHIRWCKDDTKNLQQSDDGLSFVEIANLGNIESIDDSKLRLYLIDSPKTEYEKTILRVFFFLFLVLVLVLVLFLNLLPHCKLTTVLCSISSYCYAATVCALMLVYTMQTAGRIVWNVCAMVISPTACCGTNVMPKRRSRYTGEPQTIGFLARFLDGTTKKKSMKLFSMMAKFIVMI
jgi:hypothetical protein